MRALVLQRIRALSFGSVVALSSCASPARDDSPDTKAAVESIWNEYSASLNAGDLDRWLGLWTEDGIQMPPGEPAVVGKKRIRTRNGAFLDRFTFDMTITNEEVQAAGDWAYARGAYKAKLTPKAGGDAVPIDGKYMTVLVRQADGSWKIHRDIFNSNAASN
jgi:uncharacterized protein (TIGR02246 family)